MAIPTDLKPCERSVDGMIWREEGRMQQEEKYRMISGMVV
jgi:hypothetical protein